MDTTQLTTSQILQLLSAFKKRRQKEYDITSLGIFGSFAREQAEASSDVDVVFETPSPNLFKTARIQHELETLLNRKVDIVRLRQHMNPRLKERIMHEAMYV